MSEVSYSMILNLHTAEFLHGNVLRAKKTSSALAKFAPTCVGNKLITTVFFPSLFTSIMLVSFLVVRAKDFQHFSLSPARSVFRLTLIIMLVRQKVLESGETF